MVILGRPKENPRRKQSCKMTCYITETEYEAMKVLCDNMGFTVSQFMRKAMLEKLHRMNKRGENNG